MKKDGDMRAAPALSADAIYENSFKGVYPAAKATGLRLFGLRHRAQGQVCAPRVAEDFLVNSRVRRFDREFALSAQSFYFDAAAVMSSLVGHESIAEANEISLPAPLELSMDITEVIRRRRSRSDYSGEPIAFDEFATVLWCANGITGRGEVKHVRGGRTWIHFRTTPSGGALYPIELYAAALNVDRVPRGLYRYAPVGNRILETADSTIIDRLLATFCLRDEQVSLNRAGFVLLLIARPWRAMRKYGARGLRNIFIEAGQISQNIHLACVSLGLGSLDCSSVYDDEAHEVLRVDGIYETLAHTLVIGHPSES
jgi:SagB-type dehydrogenase family enzyme